MKVRKTLRIVPEFRDGTILKQNTASLTLRLEDGIAILYQVQRNPDGKSFGGFCFVLALFFFFKALFIISNLNWF